MPNDAERWSSRQGPGSSAKPNGRAKSDKPQSEGAAPRPPRPDLNRTSPANWRRVFDRVEHAIGPQLEQLVQTEQFAQFLAASTRVEAQIRREAERRMSKFWHSWNLSSGSDLARTREQLARLERRLIEISAHLEQSLDRPSDDG